MPTSEQKMRHSSFCLSLQARLIVTIKLIIARERMKRQVTCNKLSKQTSVAGKKSERFQQSVNHMCEMNPSAIAFVNLQ